MPADTGVAYMFLTGLDHLPAPALSDFLVDMHEVTNRQFAAFVAAGGYRRPEFWKQPFVNHGCKLAWQEALSEMRDATGQPGPAILEFDVASYRTDQARRESLSAAPPRPRGRPPVSVLKRKRTR